MTDKPGSLTLPLNVPSTMMETGVCIGVGRKCSAYVAFSGHIRSNTLWYATWRHKDPIDGNRRCVVKWLECDLCLVSMDNQAVDSV